MNGCEIVWPDPMGSAPSSYASPRMPSGTKSSRGTRAIASSTRSSEIPRCRSCRSTMARRSAAGSAATGPRSLRERAQTRVARRLASAHPERESRQHDGDDVAQDGDQGEHEDQDPHGADVGAHAEPRRSAPHGAEHDDRGRERSHEPADDPRDGLRRAPDPIADHRTPGRAEHDGDARPHGVRGEEAREDHTEPEPEPERDADRVPVVHAASLRSAGLLARNPFDRAARSARVSTERGGLAMRRRTVLTGVALVLGALLVVSLAIASGGKRNFQARGLNGYEENPDVSTVASGSLKATVDEDAQTVTYELTYSGLEGDVQQSHIHFGKPAINGGIRLFLCSNLGNGPAGTPPCPQSGTVSRTVPASDIVGPTPQGIEAGNLSELVAAMRAGHAYANVHSTKWPGGEIRAQIK